MIVFPAIDLKGGEVVRLAEGDMDRATVYGDNPAAQATLFAEAGAEHLHVVDLDGSFAGRAENREAVERIDLRMFEPRDLGVRDQHDVHRTVGAERVETFEEAPPVVEGEHIAFAVAGFLDRRPIVLGANLLPDQCLPLS